MENYNKERSRSMSPFPKPTAEERLQDLSAASRTIGRSILYQGYGWDNPIKFSPYHPNPRVEKRLEGNSQGDDTYINDVEFVLTGGRQQFILEPDFVNEPGDQEMRNLGRD